MPISPSSNAARRPTVDEWGVYDPQQAGLVAVYTRLTSVPASTPVEAAADISRAPVTGDSPARTPTPIR
jgi:hypothetical protein